MKISELLKDKTVSIEVIEETRSVSEHVYGGLFGGFKKKISNDDWAGYAVVKNGNKILETFGYNRTKDYYAWSLTINGKKQSVDKDVAKGIFFDIKEISKFQDKKYTTHSIAFLPSLAVISLISVLCWVFLLLFLSSLTRAR